MRDPRNSDLDLPLESSDGLRLEDNEAYAYAPDEDYDPADRKDFVGFGALEPLRGRGRGRGGFAPEPGVPNTAYVELDAPFGVEEEQAMAEVKPERKVERIQRNALSKFRTTPGSDPDVSALMAERAQQDVAIRSKFDAKDKKTKVAAELSRRAHTVAARAKSKIAMTKWDASRLRSELPPEVIEKRVVPLDFFVETQRKTLQISDSDAKRLQEVLTEDASFRYKRAQAGGAVNWPNYVAGLYVNEVLVERGEIKPCDDACRRRPNAICVKARMPRSPDDAGLPAEQEACVDLQGVLELSKQEFDTPAKDPRICDQQQADVCVRSLRVTPDSVATAPPKTYGVLDKVTYFGPSKKVPAVTNTFTLAGKKAARKFVDLRHGEQGLIAPMATIKSDFGPAGQVECDNGSGVVFSPETANGGVSVCVPHSELGMFRTTLHSYCFLSLVPLVEEDVKEFYALGLLQAIDSVDAAQVDTTKLCAEPGPGPEPSDRITMAAPPRAGSALAPIWVFVIGLASTAVLVVTAAHFQRKTYAPRPVDTEPFLAEPPRLDEPPLDFEAAPGAAQAAVDDRFSPRASVPAEDDESSVSLDDQSSGN